MRRPGRLRSRSVAALAGAPVGDVFGVVGQVVDVIDIVVVIVVVDVWVGAAEDVECGIEAAVFGVFARRGSGSD